MDDPPTQIYRFDGTAWNKQAVDESLTDELIWSIEESPGGVLWVGTESKGVYRYDGNIWTSFSTEDGLSGNRIGSIVFSDDSVWIVVLGTGRGSSGNSSIARFDGKIWSTYNKSNGGSYEDNIYDIAISKDDRIFVSTYKGLFSFDGQEWSPPYIESKPGRTEYRFFASSDQIWAYGYDGFYKFDGEKWLAFPVADLDLSVFNWNNTKVIIASDGAVWFGVVEENSTSKLFRFDNNSWTTYTIPFYGVDTWTVDLIADQQNRIWIPQDDLYILDPQKVVSESFRGLINTWIITRKGIFAVIGLCLVILVAVWIRGYVRAGGAYSIKILDVLKFISLLLGWAAIGAVGGLLGSIIGFGIADSLSKLNEAYLLLWIIAIPIGAVTGAILAALVRLVLIYLGLRAKSMNIANIISFCSGVIVGLIIYIRDW